MTYKISILSAALLAAVVVGVSGAAVSAVTESGEQRTEMSEQHTGMTDTQHQRIEEKKAALQERAATMKANATKRLEAKRLEVCEKRQTKINEIVSRGATQNTKQLAVFQKIEERVITFATDKSITSEAIDTAIAVADEKEASAVAAIEAAKATTFDCTTTDGANPGSVIKQAMTSRHTALKEYRTAIKNLIVAVKQANNDAKTTETSTDTTATEER